MAKVERREKLALDEAYRLFHKTLEGEHAEQAPDIYSIARSLKTVSKAIESADGANFKLTVRLWQRIERALFEKLITSHPAHLVVYSTAGNVLKPKEKWTEEAVIELHPEGLRRNEDCFRLKAKDLNSGTRARLEKLWTERGPSVRSEDFLDVEEECGEYCTPKNFVIGDEILRTESMQGKANAYAQYWDLFWQSYCTSNPKEKKVMTQQMNALESVWGNLYY
jgi:hypothetical protein